MKLLLSSVSGLSAFFAIGAAMGAMLDDKGFVRDWLVSGPWPSYQENDRGQGLDTDFLKVEEEAQPYPGKAEKSEFVADWGVLVAGIGSFNIWGFKTNTVYDASWRVLHADAGIIRTDTMFPPIRDYFVMYAVCYVDSPRRQQARIAIGSDDDHKVFLDMKQVGRAESSQDIIPGSFKYDVVLPKGRSRILFKLQDRTGGSGFCLQLTDREDRPLEDVSISTDSRGVETTLDAVLTDLRSPEKLRARLAAARETIVRTKAALEPEHVRRQSLSNECAAAEASLCAAYAVREKMYADEHAGAVARGRRSVSEPFEPCARRSTLCLNGFWESSVDGRKTWGRSLIPCRILSDYFYSWRYPVSRQGKPLPGYEDLEDKVRNSPHVVFRTKIAWDGSSDLVLRCDAILGVEVEVLVNGNVCGRWNGDRGIVRVPLAGLVRGENQLELAVDRREGRLTHGIRGDLYLESVPKVRVDDVWIKTSWRKSMLSAKIGLVNRSTTAVSANVESYAVRDGKVRFRLPVRKINLPAGGEGTVKAQDGWADPLTWGIGGRFGEPNLYTLVTDVRVDGRIVDRHEVEFGFREFWICHTDFFFNGRRIFLQGDVGHLEANDKRRRDIVWPLYRADGINIIRVHDSDQWSVTAVRDADRMGMAIYAQMYPLLPQGEAACTAFPTWKTTDEHWRNIAAYTRWWKDFRNHPSVLIWSTDNEILTQAWDSEAKAAYNVSRDRIGAIYSDFMNELDKDLVVTRDGDLGTLNHQSRWFQDPPCPTANYHYPNFNNEKQAVNWQETYEYRPIIFGEALYCSYLQPKAWVGGLPKLVKDKAALVEKCVGLYTKLEIPCAVYMGLGLDGFTMLDDTGKGNPWGIKASDLERFKKDKTPIPGRRIDQYPWQRIDWPAYSGEGERFPVDHAHCNTWGTDSVNFYEAGVPSHVRNAVNDAYRKVLRPQPPIYAGRFAEAIVETHPSADVWTTTSVGNRLGVRADPEGRAWFRFLDPGRRTFESDSHSKAVDLAPRGAEVAKPGFVNIPRISIKGNKQ